MEPKRSKIGERNDEIRKQGLFGEGEPSSLFLTPGVIALGDDMLHDVLCKFIRFNDFDPDDDPFGDRDFGEYTIDGVNIRFRIEPSPNHPDNRIITICLPEED